MILEALVSTLNSDASVNIAPMGPNIAPKGPGVDFQCSQFDLKPFDNTTTYANLKREGVGVLHISDDVLLFARAATSQLEMKSVQTVPAEKIKGQVIVDACRWFEFQVIGVDQTTPRPVFKCQTLKRGRGRDFWGFNRGKHAVLEAAILATRVSFLPPPEVKQQYERLETIVKKTGGCEEREAFEILKSFVESLATV